MEPPRKSRRQCVAMQMPRVGFGTYKLGVETEDCVSRALSLGYRMIDTAQIYGNEKAVGKAIVKSGLNREDIFVTSKVWRTNHGYAPTKDSVLKSLRDLGMDYIDLMLVHWPGPKTGWPLRRGTFGILQLGGRSTP